MGLRAQRLGRAAWLWLGPLTEPYPAPQWAQLAGGALWGVGKACGNLTAERDETLCRSRWVPRRKDLESSLCPCRSGRGSATPDGNPATASRCMWRSPRWSAKEGERWLLTSAVWGAPVGTGSVNGKCKGVEPANTIGSGVYVMRAKATSVQPLNKSSPLLLLVGLRKLQPNCPPPPGCLCLSPCPKQPVYRPSLSSLQLQNSGPLGSRAPLPGVPALWWSHQASGLVHKGRAPGSCLGEKRVWPEAEAADSM